MSDPMEQESGALRWAAMHGHAECVRLLLPVSDPKARESEALRYAAENGHEECLRLLLPVSNQKALKFLALRSSARNGHAECVKLLAVSGPRLEIKRALKEAMAKGDSKIAALLIGEAAELIDEMDLSKCLAAAVKKKHGDLASYLSSIIEQRELVGVAPGAAACGGRRHARL